ncbi:MAG: succinate dehydrogenase, cytochrome b556 subunit [Burkholderiaceae bacterium]|nr:succinate dehydrogenase, cytochrome b556 subunit [Burkholderiaceae bacterium]
MSGLEGGARPRFRNIDVSQLSQYRLPAPGLVSILHRISGAMLFLLGIPFLLYLFQESLTSELSYQNFQQIASHWFAKLVLLGLIWSFIHHFCAGIRFLLLDVHIGVEKEQARAGAKIVLGASVFLTLVAALKLFGAF